MIKQLLFFYSGMLYVIILQVFGFAKFDKAKSLFGFFVGVLMFLAFYFAAKFILQHLGVI